MFAACFHALQSKGLGFSLKPKKKKAPLRKRADAKGEDGYSLGRYDPLLLDVAEDALAGRLGADDYPYVRCGRAGGLCDVLGAVCAAFWGCLHCFWGLSALVSGAALRWGV